MKHALIVATIGGFITSFEKNDIKILQSYGYRVHVACDVMDKKKAFEEMGVIVYDIPFARSPFSRRNLTAYRRLKAVMQKTKFSLVHCHTPVGGVLARIVSRKYRKNGCKVIYTAHGFHFYKGAPLKNWLIFYPIEKFFARWTDVLITINKEDYKRAKKDFGAKKVVYMPGVGVDVSGIESVVGKRKELLQELNLSEPVKLLVSVGELNVRKNHHIILESLPSLPEQMHYLIVGQGGEEKALLGLAAELKVENRVHFLGYRTDVIEIIKSCDMFVFPSVQEGLPVALMEAMASGLLIVCSNIRGNNDLIENGQGGFLCSPKDADGFAGAIKRLSEGSYDEMKQINQQKIKKFDINVVNNRMKKIYSYINHCS